EPAAQVDSPLQTVLFPVLERHRWGFIDRSGRVVVPTRFESIVATESGEVDGSAGGLRGDPDELFMAPSVEPQTTAIVAVRSRGKWGFVGPQGRPLEPRFDQVGPFSEGLAPALQGALWGFVGVSGRLEVPLRFERAGTFMGGVAIVGQDARYGIIDREGRFVA